MRSFVQGGGLILCNSREPEDIGVIHPLIFRCVLAASGRPQSRFSALYSGRGAKAYSVRLRRGYAGQQGDFGSRRSKSRVGFGDDSASRSNRLLRKADLAQDDLERIIALETSRGFLACRRPAPRPGRRSSRRFGPGPRMCGCDDSGIREVPLRKVYITICAMCDRGVARPREVAPDPTDARKSRGNACGDRRVVRWQRAMRQTSARIRESWSLDQSSRLYLIDASCANQGARGPGGRDGGELVELRK